MLADYVFNGRFSRFFSGPRCTSRMPSRTRAGLACRAMCLRRLPPFAQETLIDSSLDLCRDILARHTARRCLAEDVESKRSPTVTASLSIPCFRIWLIAR